jgi:hypothetical protein
MWPSCGRAGQGGNAVRPRGRTPSAWTVTPSPASATALRPLKLLLVHTVRQLCPVRSSASKAIARLMLGELHNVLHHRLSASRCARFREHC